METVDSMIELLYSNILKREGFDKKRWKLNVNGKCDVHSYSAMLQALSENYFLGEACVAPRRAAGFLLCVDNSLGEYFDHL